MSNGSAFLRVSEADLPGFHRKVRRQRITFERLEPRDDTGGVQLGPGRAGVRVIAGEQLLHLFLPHLFIPVGDNRREVHEGHAL